MSTLALQLLCHRVKGSTCCLAVPLRLVRPPQGTSENGTYHCEISAWSSISKASVSCKYPWRTVILLSSGLTPHSSHWYWPLTKPHAIVAFKGSATAWLKKKNVHQHIYSIGPLNGLQPWYFVYLHPQTACLHPWRQCWLNPKLRALRSFLCFSNSGFLRKLFTNAVLEKHFGSCFSSRRFKNRNC